LAVVFEWDSRKEKTNRRKHGVSFAEASSVFDDSLAKIFYDYGHSGIEVREIIVGHSLTGALLLVSFTERLPDRVRIISARKATRMEKKDYEEAC
jgi:uncharacterized DUF497 family protein